MSSKKRALASAAGNGSGEVADSLVLVRLAEQHDVSAVLGCGNGM